MTAYYLNRNAQANGDHEVHTEHCQHLPEPHNRIYLGEHSGCHSAVATAKFIHPEWKINECFYCSRVCQILYNIPWNLSNVIQDELSRNTHRRRYMGGMVNVTTNLGILDLLLLIFTYKIVCWMTAEAWRRYKYRPSKVRVCQTRQCHGSEIEKALSRMEGERLDGTDTLRQAQTEKSIRMVEFAIENRTGAPIHGMKMRAEGAGLVSLPWTTVGSVGCEKGTWHHKHVIFVLTDEMSKSRMLPDRLPMEIDIHWQYIYEGCPMQNRRKFLFSG